jgi:Flp pilus assembly protein CpaB
VPGDHVDVILTTYVDQMAITLKGLGQWRLDHSRVDRN